MNGLVVTGTVLEVEHKKGDFTREDGSSMSYDFKVATVLAGTKVIEVRFNPDNGDAQPPAEGAEVSILVDLPQKIKVIAKRYVPAAVEGRRSA